MKRVSPASLALLAALAPLVACSTVDDTGASTGDDPQADRKRHHADAGVAAPDASTGAGDGTPERLPCTSHFGTALTGGFGRLDGRLVALVPPGTNGCSSDSGHLHLQVVANGQTYDVAATINDKASPAGDFYLERDVAMNETWSEGWHTGVSLDYPTLGVHSGDFKQMNEPELQVELTGLLQRVNHVSVFMTPYGSGGGHLVHRRGGGADGALILDPLAPVSHVLMFHFVSQTF